MTSAQRVPADPIPLRTSLRIAVDSVLRKPDEEAPGSDLFLFGRKQDPAFEKPVGGASDAEPGTISTSVPALSLVSKGEGRAAPGAEALATNKMSKSDGAG